MAEVNSEFSDALDQMDDRLMKLVDQMNLSDEAKAAARKTIEGYIAGLGLSGGTLLFDAYNLSNQLNDSFDNDPYAVARATAYHPPGFAAGTLDAPDMFIAGERGPELIVGAGGSSVFPADKTNAILSAIEPPAGFDGPSYGGGVYNRVFGDKKVTLDISGGGGTIQITGGNIDREAIWNAVSPMIKPKVLDILETEIFEEGDESNAI